MYCCALCIESDWGVFVVLNACQLIAICITYINSNKENKHRTLTQLYHTIPYNSIYMYYGMLEREREREYTVYLSCFMTHSGQVKC